MPAGDCTGRVREFRQVTGVVATERTQAVTLTLPALPCAERSFIDAQRLRRQTGTAVVAGAHANPASTAPCDGAGVREVLMRARAGDRVAFLARHAAPAPGSSAGAHA